LGQFGTSSTNTTNKSEKKWGLDNKRDCFPLSFTKKHYQVIDYIKTIHT